MLPLPAFCKRGLRSRHAERASPCKVLGAWMSLRARRCLHPPSQYSDVSSGAAAAGMNPLIGVAAVRGHADTKAALHLRCV
eukprot:4820653-Pleurochrysis_carterae.AAC.2